MLTVDAIVLGGDRPGRRFATSARVKCARRAVCCCTHIRKALRERRMRGRFGSSNCCFEMSLIGFPLSVSVHQLLRKRLGSRTDRPRSRTFVLRAMSMRMPPGLVEGDHRAPFRSKAGPGELGVGDDSRAGFRRHCSVHATADSVTSPMDGWQSAPRPLVVGFQQARSGPGFLARVAVCGRWC